MDKLKILRKNIIINIRCVFFFLSTGREFSTWPANNCLQIMVCSCVVPPKRVFLQIIFCLCVIGATFSREKWQIASLSCQKVIKIRKQSWRSNDKTIIELGYHKISWFASVSQINYLLQPSASANNWTARHWQIKIFCSTSSNNNKLLEEVEHDIMNYKNWGLCYLAEADNTDTRFR